MSSAGSSKSLSAPVARVNARRIMRYTVLAIAVFLLVVLARHIVTKRPDGNENKSAPEFSIGTETIHLTGPHDADGYIDYEAALNEQLAKGVTPENNANVLLWRLFGPQPEGGEMPAEFFRLLGIDAPPARGDYFIDLERYLTEQVPLEPGPQTQAVNDELDRVTQRSWKPQQHPHLAAWLKVNERPFAIAIEAGKRPRYFNPLVSKKTENGAAGLLSALLPNVQKSRQLATALVARAMLHTGDNRTDDAWQDLLATHRLGRAIGRGATLIELLVAIAIEDVAMRGDIALLDSGKLTAKQLQDYPRELSALPPLSTPADKIELGERFFFFDTAMLIRRKGFRAVEVGPGALPDRKEVRLLQRVDWGTLLCQASQWYDRVVATLRIPDRTERQCQQARLETEVKALKPKNDGSITNLVPAFLQSDKAVTMRFSGVLISLLVPALIKVQDAADRIEQGQRNLRLAFALAGYHRDHGRYPAKLEALAPKYLAAVPDDIFAGKPLIYRPNETGYLLHSVGVNGLDEGGRWYDDDPPGDDPRVRMPLPELKRKEGP